jgi:hypothetical protein
VRACEIRKPKKEDATLEAYEPKLKKRREDRKSGQLDAAEGLVQDAIDQDRPKPDLESVVARIEHLEQHCSPNAPDQRVMLWLVDEPPYFRATTNIIRRDRGQGPEIG